MSRDLRLQLAELAAGGTRLLRVEGLGLLFRHRPHGFAHDGLGRHGRDLLHIRQRHIKTRLTRKGLPCQ